MASVSVNKIPEIVTVAILLSLLITYFEATSLIRNQVSKRRITGARYRLMISTSPITDIARIILPCLVCYFHTEDMVGPEIHDSPLDDQLTVDFTHQLS